jgi:hypothetical protein
LARIAFMTSSAGSSCNRAKPGSHDEQYADAVKVPNGYCPNHATGVKLPDDFKVTPLEDID